MSARSKIASVLIVVVVTALGSSALRSTDRTRALAEALPQHEKRFGESSLEVADTLDLLVEIAVDSGDCSDPDLVAFASRAVAIRQSRQGDDDPDLATSLHNQAGLYLELGDYREAIAIERRALDLLQTAFGPEHWRVAPALNRLARLYERTDRREEAIALLRQALAICERELDPTDPRVADTLEVFGEALPFGDPAKKASVLRALEIRELTAGPDHPSVGRPLSRLGVLLWRESKPLEASRVFERALAVYEVAYGADSVRVSRVLNNLAIVLGELGDLARARQMLERALAIKVRQLGPDHLDVAVALMNLGEAAKRMGDYPRARELWERALELRRAQLGAEHRLVANALRNIGQAQSAVADFEGARFSHEQALAIRLKLAGAEADIADERYQLAHVFAEMRRDTEAREQVRLALETQVAIWGPVSSQVGLSKMLLGRLDARAGRYEEALALLTDATVTFEKTVGQRSSYLPLAQATLAALLRAMGRNDAALVAAIEAEQLARAHFRNATRIFTEHEALQFGAARISGLDVALTIVADGATPRTTAAVLDEVIRSRALVLDEMATRHANYLAEDTAEHAELIDALAAARNAVARSMIVGLRADRPPDYDERMQRVARSAAAAERRLAERSRGFRERLERFAIGLDEVRRAIPAEAVLVAYARYGHRQGVDDSSPAYLAFVLRPGDSRPRVVSLGPAAEIDASIRRWRAEAAVAPPPFPAAARAAEERYREAGAALRRTVWDPIRPLLHGAELVLVVPDGDLHLVSLTTLPEADGSYMVEAATRIHYLSSERDLSATTRVRSGGHGLLALGGPDYDAGPATVDAAAIDTAPTLAVAHDLRQSCAELRNRVFRPLPGARAEASEIAALWDDVDAGGDGSTLLLTGRAADEAAFKGQAPGRGVIHLATHGFLSPRVCASVVRGSLTDDRAALENPFLYSGLVLAGANRRDDLGEEVGRDDGMLTAQEIASIDLSGAEWVVLSACETGVGPVQLGEGVLGLRRAFEIAGAGTLIMSLWEVKDEATRAWMRELYRGRLEGLSTADAVRRASLLSIESRRGAGESTHPFYWGAFVAAGDWR